MLGLSAQPFPFFRCASIFLVHRRAPQRALAARHISPYLPPIFPCPLLYLLLPLKLTHTWNPGGLGAPIDGVLQSYRTFPSLGLLPIPPHLSYEEASCFPCAGVTAWNALYGGIALKPGQTVLFQGTGGVSVLGMIFAGGAGAKVRFGLLWRGNIWSRGS